jgi:hypothetical protein
VIGKLEEDFPGEEFRIPWDDSCKSFRSWDERGG